MRYRAAIFAAIYQTGSQKWPPYKICDYPGAVALPGLRQPPRTSPLMANATNGRPMSMKTRGHGFVSKAENTEMVAYSTNKNPNQQMSAIFKPHVALGAFNRAISHASV
jgi:hypothetical protein